MDGAGSARAGDGSECRLDWLWDGHSEGSGKPLGRSTGREMGMCKGDSNRPWLVPQQRGEGALGVPMRGIPPVRAPQRGWCLG